VIPLLLAQEQGIAGAVGAGGYHAHIVALRRLKLLPIDDASGRVGHRLWIDLERLRGARRCLQREGVVMLSNLLTVPAVFTSWVLPRS